MQITKVRIAVNSKSNSRFLGSAAIIFDHCFIVHDLKIISGDKGTFVAMPSRKRCIPCDQCRVQNEVMSSYCKKCGTELKFDQLDSTQKLFIDVAHPLEAGMRSYIEKEVLNAFEEELQRLERENHHGITGSSGGSGGENEEGGA